MPIRKARIRYRKSKGRWKYGVLTLITLLIMPIRKTRTRYRKSKGRWKYGVLTLITLLIAIRIGFFLDFPGARQCLTSANLEQCQLLGKTAWEWLELLGIPLSLAILGYILQRQQQKRAEDENKEEILQIYFDRLSMLLIDKNLLALAVQIYPQSKEKADTSPQELRISSEQRELFAAAMDVVRARTLSILRRFENDPARKAIVIQFLVEAEVINKAKVNLGGANLEQANLRWNHLRGANLSGANLSGADLGGADLSGAHLEQANFNGANLEWAWFSGAHLEQANFNGANLEWAQFSGAHLMDVDLSGANLSEANFSGANLMEVNLCGLKLKNNNLQGANFSGANLKNSNLSGANLSGANLKWADLVRVNLNDTNLTSTSLEGAYFSSVAWNDETRWPAPEEVAKAKNVPELLKQQLGIK